MGCCGKCLTRVPYGTLIATILCVAGAGTFLGCLYYGVHKTLRMLQDVFSYNSEWLSDMQVVFIIIGAFMGVLSIVLLFVGIFSTGATRSKIYRGWKARVGGRISCALCMSIVYVLNLIWLVVVCCLVAIVFVFYILWGLCNNPVSTDPTNKCVDLQQFHFLFPEGTETHMLNICAGKRKILCTDTVGAAGQYFTLSLAAALLVIISLVHYLMCLAANYTRIKDHEKFHDLQELQYLQDSEMGTLPKDRF